MSKKIVKIVLSVIVVLAIVLFVVYKFDSANRAQESMTEVAERLADSICKNDFDKIKSCVKNTDGEDLSEQEIYNFLLNTDLYRLTFYTDEKVSPTYVAKADFFNIRKGDVSFSFSALDGDLIIETLKYVNTGVHEYFVTEDIKESDKEVKKYPFAKDLANGEEFRYDNEDSENDYFLRYRYGKDENDGFYIEVIEEAKDDLKIAIVNSLDDTLKDKDDEYRYEWNEDCSVFSVYYNADDLSIKEDALINVTAIFSATAIQALNEKPDWKLTINYYGYSTEELLETSIIR